jgi:hypothetical protein
MTLLPKLGEPEAPQSFKAYVEKSTSNFNGRYDSREENVGEARDDKLAPLPAKVS